MHPRPHSAAIHLFWPLCFSSLHSAAIAQTETDPIQNNNSQNTPVAIPIADNNPALEAVILSLRGDQAMLNVGSERGAQVGAIYGVIRDGQVRVSMRVILVDATRSTAVILDKETKISFAVGDKVQFIAMATVPLEPTPALTQPPVIEKNNQVADPVPNPKESTDTNPLDSSNTVPPVTEIRALSPSESIAGITSLNIKNVTIGVGVNRGLRVGRNLPLLRNGEAIGMVRVQAVNADSSDAIIIWQDENAGPISTEDKVQLPAVVPLIVGVSPTDTTNVPDEGFIPVKGGDKPDGPIPSTQQLYETGASNIGVPRADRTYEYLAALAASGVITRYPAEVFEDEGVRFHRTAEDQTFTRAQITDLVREALGERNKLSGDLSSRDELILSELVREYSTDLHKVGVPLANLTEITSRKGFQIGFSGQQSATVVAGDNDDFLVPFSERQGGQRTKSGFDTRLNIFGRAGKRTNFFATLDAGSKIGERRRGSEDDNNFKVRRAVVSYDAGNMLRGLTFEAGRNEFWLGPGHFGTLILGDTAGPLNNVSYRFKRGAFSTQGIYAPLGSGPNGGSRSLYVKDTRLQIGSQAMIGYSESVLAPRDHFDPALFAAVFSPLPLALVQRRKSNDNEDSNLLQSFYAELGVARGLRAYGELLVDDIGVNNENLALNRIGTLLGAHLFAPNDPGKLGIYGEYAHLQGRTYLRYGNLDPDYEYYYRDRPLGYPVAPVPGSALPGLPGLGGAESLRLEAYWRPIDKLRLTAGVELADLNSERFDLSRQQTLRFSAAYSLSRTLSILGRAQRVSTSQPDFAPNVPALKQNFFQLELRRSF